MNSGRNTSTSRERAIEIVFKHMADQGYKHGPVIEAKESTTGRWIVELAYDGLCDRSETSDPPSIVLSVGQTDSDIKALELM